MLLTDQLRTANSENEKLSYKVDFLLKQVQAERETSARYQGMSERIAAKMELMGTHTISFIEAAMAEGRAGFWRAPVQGAAPAGEAQGKNSERDDALLDEPPAAEMARRLAPSEVYSEGDTQPLGRTVPPRNQMA